MLMSEMRRIRLEDIARLAGVSKMTVSLALRGQKRVSPEKRATICRIAAELGYTPDPALSALNAYRRGRRPPKYAETIAFINAFDEPLSESRYLYNYLYFKGAEAKGRLFGYRVEEFRLKPAGKSPSLDRILRTRGITGVIVGDFPIAHAALDLSWENYCAVSMAFSMESPHLHVVTNDHFQSMFICMEALAKRGYRRIGLCFQIEQDEKVGRRWSGGYLAARQVCLASDDHLQPLLYTTFDLSTFHTWVDAWQPDCIITGDPLMMGYIQAIGRAYPDEIAVAIPYQSQYAAERCQGYIDENYEHSGAMAFDTVAGMIHRNERGIPDSPMHLMIPGVFVLTDHQPTTLPKSDIRPPKPASATAKPPRTSARNARKPAPRG
ncbi:MAG: LacI family transcriptional regulator [Puniceicoccaceae bacterium]|nr:MAG: LacI family transcriptional regulator [Puniceicoccaceae bacterium]